MNEWNIQARASHCQACTNAFADKQIYHTLLFDDKQVLTRLDVCEPCWQGQYRHGTNDRKGFVSHWQGVYEVPPAPTDPIQKENAESLLRKIMELASDGEKFNKYREAAYILAVMLERKRLLKVKEQFFRDGSRIFVYEHGPSGDVFTIVDPNLQLNQLDQVQRDVAFLLEHGLESAAAAQSEETPSQPAGEDACATCPPTPAVAPVLS